MDAYNKIRNKYWIAQAINFQLKALKEKKAKIGEK